MYGLLLENLSEFIKTVYGEDKWEDIRRQAGVDAPTFSVHQVYPENLLQKLAKKAQQVCFFYVSSQFPPSLNQIIFLRCYILARSISFLEMHNILINL